MVRSARILYLVTSWAFMIALVIQTFLIGMGLFSDPSYRVLHANVGWIMHLAPLLVLLFAYLARAGKSHWQWALGLAAVVLVFPILPSFGGVAAALHPVGAVIAFAISVVVARNSLRAYRQPPAPVTA